MLPGSAVLRAAPGRSSHPSRLLWREAGAPSGSLQDGGAEEEPVAECEEPTRSPGRGLGIGGRLGGLSVAGAALSSLRAAYLSLAEGDRRLPLSRAGPPHFPDGGACALRAWPSGAGISLF